MQNETISIPSYNPAEIQSETGKYNFILNKALQKVEKVAPAQIISYDRNRNRAVVQILNMGITSTGEKLPKKPLDNIPALMLSGGGFTFSFPIKTGDTGWLIAADRDISIFKQALKMFAPATYQIHQYKDSFFVPDKVNGFDVSTDEENAVILTSDDGTTKISINNGKINISAPQTEITGDVKINGSITATGDIQGAGISLSTHVHNSVQPGSGTSGGPQ